MKNKPKKGDNALIRQFYASPLTGEEIEARSFEIIDREVAPHLFGTDEWQVVRRMIHTTGDLSIMVAVRFSPQAISAGIAALREGRPIYVDSKMIQSGLSLPRLQSVCKGYDPSHIVCHVADEDVVREARRAGIPRSLFALRKAKPLLEGNLAVFGNSPIALLELNRLILEENIRPSLVIAMPVGFVHVVESKEELMSLPVPYIALAGKRGGSPLAVSAIHALCSIAADFSHQNVAAPVSPERKYRTSSPHPSPLRGEGKGEGTGAVTSPRTDAVILMGHGSRVPEAGKDMKAVARGLKDKYGYSSVEICFASRLGPHFPQVFQRCVNQGAQKVLVIPYFLHGGMHMLLDIPEMMQEAAQRFPHVKLILGKSLGYDEGLVDLVEKRILESKDLPDVRDLPLPERGKYPVPPGQYEFVPMLPEEAAKYRK